MSQSHPIASSGLENGIGPLPSLVPRSRRPPQAVPEPAPETPTKPTLQSLTPTLPYTPPRRRVITKADMLHFHASPTYQLVLWFVFSLADAAKGGPISSAPSLADGQKSKVETKASKVALRIRDVLLRIEKLVDDNPREENAGSRFGNPAFRKFFDALADEEELESIHECFVELGLPAEAVKEVGVYLRQSFGDRERVDYGSGHELNFILWLLCLDRFGLVTKADQEEDTVVLRTLVLRIFPQYLSLVRKVQLTYYLEPAGSHGVWGLDDYQFLPFLFGAAQLTGPEHPYLRPRSIHQALMVEEGKREYLYFDQIDWINSTKTVKGIQWHSPMLNDISSAKNWAKIEGGMRKMFVNEVLGKVPILQHFLFGQVLPSPEGVPDRLLGAETGSTIDGEGDECAGHDHEAGGEKIATTRASDGHVVLDRDGNPLPIPKHSHGDDGGHGEDGGDESANGGHECGGLADPCGIKIPSGVAAVMEMRKRMAGELRTLPFD